MLALGLILIIVAALVVLTVLFGANNASITFDLTLFDVQTTPLGVFLMGAATLLVLVTGLALVQRGTRSQLQLRRDRKELARLHAREGRTGDAGGATGTTSSPTTAERTTATEPGGEHRRPLPGEEHGAPEEGRRPPV